MNNPDRPRAALTHLIRDLFFIAWAVFVLAAYGPGMLIDPMWAALYSLAAAEFNVSVQAFVHAAGALGFMAGFGLFGVLLGRRLLALCRVELAPEQSLPASFALGAGGIGLVMFLLAAAGLFNPVVIRVGAGTALVLLIVANRDAFRRIGSLEQAVAAFSLPRRPFTIFLACLAAPILVLVVLASLTPEIFYDSLVYHLGLPNLYLLEGGLVRTPECSFAGMPNLIEMVFAFAMAICGETGPKSTIVVFSLFSALSLRAFVPLGIDRKATRLAMVLFFASPVTLFAATKTSVELPWALFTILAAVFLVDGFRRSDAHAPVILAGVFCGLAMATKYVAWPFFFAFVVAALAGGFLFRVDLATTLRKCVWMSLAATVVVSPWVVKNLVYYNNPVHPMMNSLFSNFREPDDIFVKQRFADNRSLSGGFAAALRRPLTFATEPWRITMQGNNESTMIGPLFLMLLPWLFVPGYGSPQRRMLVVLFVVLWLLFFAMHNYARYFIPGFAILTLLLAAAFLKVCTPRARFLLAGLMAVTVFGQTAFVFRSWWNTDAWTTVLGGTAREDYLVGSHPLYPSPYFETSRWIDANLKADAKLLIVGDARGLYYQRRFRASGQHDRQLFTLALDRAQSATDLAADLQRQGFSHIVFNYAEMIRLYDGFMPELVSFNDRQRLILEQFWAENLVEVFAENVFNANDRRFVIVYELLENARDERTPPPPRNFYLEIADELMAQGALSPAR